MKRKRLSSVFKVQIDESSDYKENDQHFGVLLENDIDKVLSVQKIDKPTAFHRWAIRQYNNGIPIQNIVIELLLRLIPHFTHTFHISNTFHPQIMYTSISKKSESKSEHFLSFSPFLELLSKDSMSNPSFEEMEQLIKISLRNSAHLWRKNYFRHHINFIAQQIPFPIPIPTPTNLVTSSLASLSRLIQQSNRIVVICGAGVSAPSGIPDFRDHKEGIYAKVKQSSKEMKIDPIEAELLFDIEFFKSDPQVFYTFFHSLFTPIQNAKPNFCHIFLSELEKRNKLLRLFTQNIDGMEKRCGMQNVVELHGSISSFHCSVCGISCDPSLLKEAIQQKKIPYCFECPHGVFRPSIVFFGEPICDNGDVTSYQNDKNEMDLLIIIGTSLRVQPVCRYIAMAPWKVPVVFINKEKVVTQNEFDICLYGDCVQLAKEICTQLSWKISIPDGE
jgi:NAD-dependent SIR2 family protein deacetylase